MKMKKLLTFYFNLNLEEDTEVLDADNLLSDQKTALHAAVLHENVKIVKWLLSTNNIDINVKEVYNHPYYIECKTALILAIDKNNKWNCRAFITTAKY